MNKAQQLYENSSEAFRKLNPHLAGRIPTQKPQPDNGSESQNRKLDSNQTRVEYSITIIQFRKRLLDSHDNLKASCKELIDRITESLGFAADNDESLHWQIEQVKTDGRPGVLVKIDRTEFA